MPASGDRPLSGSDPCLLLHETERLPRLRHGQPAFNLSLEGTRGESDTKAATADQSSTLMIHFASDRPARAERGSAARCTRRTQTEHRGSIASRRIVRKVSGVLLLTLVAVAAQAQVTQTRAEAPGVEANLPGAPRNLEVTVSRQEAEKLFVSWQAPASDGGSPITGYKIQYKLSDEETFDHEVAVSLDLSALPHKVTQVNNGSGREHTVRVVATNTAGDGPPSEEITATPLTLTGHLRAFIKKDIVERYGAAHPWLRKTWGAYESAGF